MDMLTESPMVTKLSYRKVKRGMSQLKIRTFNRDKVENRKMRGPKK